MNHNNKNIPQDSLRSRLRNRRYACGFRKGEPRARLSRALRGESCGETILEEGGRNFRADLGKALALRRSLFGRSKGFNLPDPVEYIFPKEPCDISEIKSLWRSYLANKNRDHLLSLYLHIPFCSMRCEFCNCRSAVPSKKEDIDHYLDYLINYLNYFKDTFNKIFFDNLYIGGGTPSLLGKASLDRLLKVIFSNFKFKRNGQLNCELNPLTAAGEKLRLLRNYGFNRVSFGVQSLDPRVLKLNNRGYQTVKMVDEAIKNAKAADFKYINVDLIVGLYGDSSEALVKSFEKIISFRPQKISIYPLQPKDDYLKKHFDSDPHKFEEFWRSLFERSLTRISDMARENDFYVPRYDNLHLRMASASCWSYDDLGIKPQKKDYIGDTPNHSIFGAGEGAVSKIEGSLRYETDRLASALLKSRFLGTRRNSRIAMLDYICRTLNMMNFISYGRFSELFSKDFLAEFKRPIKNLVAMGAGRILSDRFELITNDRDERTLQLLLFFSEDEIK
ncbi:MAG: hypothetical protein COT17_01295, partial [Elusimicrobia bacterium CG08_land_8_20_14_0_20_51_18]